MSKGLHIRLQLKEISAKEQQTLAEKQLKDLGEILKECATVILVINSLSITYMLLISENKTLTYPLFA